MVNRIGCDAPDSSPDDEFVRANPTIDYIATDFRHGSFRFRTGKEFFGKLVPTATVRSDRSFCSSNLKGKKRRSNARQRRETTNLPGRMTIRIERRVNSVSLRFN